MNQFQIVKEKILIKFESPMHKSIFIYSWFVVEILKKSRKLASLVILRNFLHDLQRSTIFRESLAACGNHSGDKYLQFLALT